MPPDTTPDPPSPRIVIVRLSAVGDVIHGLPVLNALRERFPGGLIAWVVEERAAALLRGHRALDELVVVPRGWLKSFGEILRLRRRLHELRLEIAIDLQGLTKSAVAAWLSGARRRIGFGDEKGREISRWLNTEWVHCPAAHIIDANLQLLAPLGINQPSVRFDIPENEADRTAATAAIAAAGIAGDFGLINPGAGWPSKLWPPARFAAVAQHLGAMHGVPTLVVWAGPKERAWAEQIVTGAAGHAHLAPATTLTELGAIARRARIFVGSDTGPLHLAAAVGTPCVGLYGPMSATRNGPYGPQHVALQQGEFHGSHRQRRNAAGYLMEAISVEMVCQACDAILRRDRR
jgi:lipopolysaccharide heptosyltransferase I